LPYLSFGQGLPTATGPLLSCVCFCCTVLCHLWFPYLVYAIRIFYVLYQAPNPFFSMRPMVPPFHPRSLQYMYHPHSPQYQYHAPTVPSTAGLWYSRYLPTIFLCRPMVVPHLTCHNFSLAPGLLSYVSQVPLLVSHCHTFPMKNLRGLHIYPVLR